MQNTQLDIGTLQDLQTADMTTVEALPVMAGVERAAWVKSALKQLGYFTLSREDKGLVRTYIQVRTQCSRAQVARYIADAQREAATEPVTKTKKTGGIFFLRFLLLPAVILLALLLNRSSFTLPASVITAPEKTVGQSRTTSTVPVYTTATPKQIVAAAYTVPTQSSVKTQSQREKAASEIIMHVAERRTSRLALMVHPAAPVEPGTTVAPREGGKPLQIFPPYPPIPGKHTAAPVVLSRAELMETLGGGTEGQIFMMQDGRPTWHDFPYLEQIRGLAPQGEEPTRRAGGLRSGGSPASNNNTTTTIVQNVGGGTSDPSGWTQGTGVVYLTTSTDSVGIGTQTPKTTLEVIGGISGASLYIASGIEGAGLADCDPTTEKILWNVTTKQFYCGTDNAVGTGLSQAAGDERYVRKSGDTMTGALVIDIENGNAASIGLNVINTISGALIHAEKGLSTSGTLVFEGAASGSSLYLGTSLQGAGLVDCSTAGTSKLLWNSATGRFSCGTDTDTDTNTTYTAGQGFTLNGSSFSLNSAITGSLVRFTTISGSTIYGKNSVNSSGSITAEGTISGANLYVGTSINGAGLIDCSTAGTSKLLWNSATGRFSCGTDQNTGTTYTAGQGLTLNGTAFTVNSTITGSLVRFTTISGSTIYGKNSVNSSGSITAEGTISGANLFAGTSIRGGGLVDCSTAGTSKLLWNSATGRFSCGTDTDTDTNTTYTAGQGMTLNGTAFSVSSTITGSLVRFNTISGSTIYGKNSVNSSGSITAEGAISGASLFVGTSISGAGLADCNTATSALQWNSSTGRFSCAVISAGSSAFSTGNVLTIGDARYVSRQGDTMTGTLTVDILNGNLGSRGINVVNTISGALIHAEKGLSTSGTFVFEGAASGSSLYIASSLRGAGLIDCDTAGTSKLLWDATTGRFSCGADQNTGTTYTAGQGMTLNGTAFTLNSTITGSLVRFTTVSGSTVFANSTLRTSGSLIVSGNGLIRGTLSGNTIHAEKSLTSSGSITAEGTISGANLYVGTSINGAGLIDCSTAGTSKLLWNSATGRFSCGTDTDTDTNTTYTAGQGMTLNGTAFSVNSTITGSLVRFNTISGSTIYGKNSVNSSGSITAEGTISGANLFAGTSIRGGGLVDCSTAGTSKLLWNSATGRFSCGTDQSGASGISQSIADERYVKKQGDTMTGVLTVNILNGALGSIGINAVNTISGALIHAEKSLTSSGSITAEGTISGANLYAGTTIRGAGLVSDCNTSTSALQWSSSTGRFSCGTIVTGGTFSTGNVLTIGGQKYVSKQGDTMTGALTINIQGGTLTSVGLNVGNTISGAMIHAQKGVTSSGTLIVSANAAANPLVRLNNSGADTAILFDSYQGQLGAGIAGPSSPGNDGSDDSAPSGTFYWSPGSIITNNGDGPIAAFDAFSGPSQFSHYYTVSDFGFNIPLNATIQGVKVEWLKWGTIDVYDNSVKIMKGGVVTGTEKATLDQWATAEHDTYTVYGGENDTWGVPLTPADVNSSNFGAALSAYSNFAEAFNGYGVLDHVRVTVYYTTSSSQWIIGNDDVAKMFHISHSNVLGTNDLLWLNGTTNIVHVAHMLSGAYLHAERGLSTSGSLVFEGAGSGQALTLGGGRVSVSQSGAVVFNAPSENIDFTVNGNNSVNVLRVDASTSRVSIGKSQGNPTTTLDVGGTISGKTLTIMGTGNSYLLGNVGIGKSGTPNAKLEVNGTISGSLIYANKALRSSGSITAEGAISGASLYIGTSIQGAGLVSDCNTSTSALQWSSSTGRFSCGTISAGSTFSTGNVLTIGNANYVSKQGDTMTGALAINIQGGTMQSVGLNVINTISGAVLHAGKELTSSGTLSVAGNAYFQGTTRLGDSSEDTIVFIGGVSSNIVPNAPNSGTLGSASLYWSDLFAQNTSIKGIASGAVLHAEKSLSTSGTLVFEGAASGSSLYLGTSLTGVGLSDCDTSSTSKLLWDATTGRFSCGTDQSGGSFSTGNVLTIGNANYVSKQGDTMTGALVIDVQGGTLGSIGLKVLNTLSGAIIHAEKGLTSSGTLLVSGNGTIKGTISGSLITQNGAGNNYFMGNVGIGTINPAVELVISDPTSHAEMQIDAGGTGVSNIKLSRGGIQKWVWSNRGHLSDELYLYNASTPVLTIMQTGDMGIGTISPDTKLEVIGTISGSTIYAANALRSSGSITAEGAISGASLYAGTSIKGAGLVSDCNTSTSALQWTASTGRFLCGTISAGSTFSTGNVLTIGNANYVSKQGDTMTGALVIDVQGGTLGSVGLNVLNTVSGALIHAEKELTTSGTLVTESGAYFDGTTMVIQAGSNRVGIGTASPEATLHVSGGKFLMGNNQWIQWKNAAGFARDVLMTDTSNNTVLNSENGDIQFKHGSTVGMTILNSNSYVGIGTSAPKTKLEVVGTISGSTIFANQSLRSSGSIVAEGAISGASLYIGTSIKGAGLVSDCNTSTSALQWSSTTGRFSCGTMSAGSTFSTGNMLTIGNAQYVQRKGDSMTGSLQTPSINLSGVLLTSLNGFNEALNLNNAGLATYGVTRLQANGNLTNIGSIQSGEINATMGGTFAAKVDYTAGSAPFSIAIGDLNGDGKADIAVANQNSTSISVFINTGTGTYRAKVDYTTGSTPRGVTIGDLNGDGKMDMIAANAGGNSVSVFINKGSGTFATKVDYTTGSSPYGVSTGDLNGDGKLDIVTANFATTTVSILLNNGNGTFATKVDYTTGSSPESVAIGDLNGDGRLDLAVANNGDSTASVLLNNGNGTFATKVDYTTGTTTAFIAIGDLNGDGKADLATANQDGNSVSVLLNTGNGTFATKVDYTTGTLPIGIIIGDINGDGKADIVTSNYTANSVSVFSNKGNGTFNTKVDYTVATHPRSLAIGDLNNDGTLDLAVANNSSTSISVLLNQSKAILYASAGTGGTVGIGTSTPGAKLAVSGSVLINNRGTIGNSGADTALEVVGTISGSTIYAADSLRSSGSIVAEGAISGASLYIGGSIQGAGLVSDCNTSTSALQWSSTTGRFSCGTISASGGSFGTGNVLTIGNANYVSKQGDTMTGALVIDIQGGMINTIGLKVINTFSGAIVQATQQLRSSGSLSVEGVSYLQGQVLSADGSASAPSYSFSSDVGTGMYRYANNVLGLASGGAARAKVDSTGLSILGGGYLLTGGGSEGSPSHTFVNDSNTGMWNSAADTLNFSTKGIERVRFDSNGNVGIGTTTPAGKFVVVGSGAFTAGLSGSTLHAEQSVTSSGSITAEGTISGANLYVGTSIRGAGLVDCSTAGTSKLMWDSSTGRFSCGADQGATFGTGNALFLGDERYVRKSGDTMTGALTIQNGNANIYTTTPLLNVRGMMSGFGLTIMGNEAQPMLTTNAAMGTMLMGTGGIRTGCGYMLPQMFVAGKTPVLLSSTTTTAAVNRMALQGSTLIATAGTVLRSFDVTNPAGPKPLSTAAVTSSNPASVVVQGKYAFIGVQIKIQSFDISNPSAMVPLHVFTPTSAVNALAIQGRYLYSLNTTSAKFQVIDVSNPANMVNVGQVTTGTTPSAIAVQGRYAYITNSGGGTMQIIDLRNPTSPVSVGTTSAGTTPNAIAVQGRYVYVMNSTGLQIFDVSNPSSVVTMGSVSTGAASAMTVVGRYAYVVGANGFQIIDISDPRGPTLVSTVSTGLVTLNQIIVQGRYAYVSYTGGTRLYVYDLGGTFMQNAEAGSMEVGSLTIHEALQGMDASFQGSISAGTSLFVAGHASFGTGGQVTIGTGGLIVRGAGMSGSSVYAATSFEGAGLTDCDIAGSSKLLWNATTGRFSCGSDANTTYTAGQGLTLNGASFSVNSTLTGTLLKFSTVSGSTVYAKDTLRSSGTLIIAGNAFIRGTLSGNIVNAQKSLNSSGSITAEGTISGANLYVGTSIRGAGLVTDCDTAATSKLLWDVTTGRFSCGTDQAGSSAFSTGNVLTIGDARYVRKSGDTMTGALNITVSGTSVGSGALTVYNTTKRGTGALIASSGTVLALNSIAASGGTFRSPHILFGYNGNFDTALWRSAVNTLSLSGNFLPGLNNKFTLGTSTMRWKDLFLSGSSLHVGANGNEGTIGYNTAGSYLTFGTTSQANALTILNANGNVGIGTTLADTKLEVVGTISGSVIYGKNSLNSSGSITAEGTISGANLYAGTSIRGAGLVTDCDTAGTSKLLWDATSGRFSCGTDADTNTTYTAGQGLTLNGASFSVNSTLTGSLAKFTTLSGSVVYGKNSLNSSGSITAEGTISGANLYVGTSIRGAGLVTDCDTAATSKLLWDVTTGRFSCGVDQSGGSFSTGNVLTIGDARYVRTSGDTMTGALNITVSGTSTGSGALTVYNTTKRGTGAYMASSGTILALNSIAARAGGFQSPHILFGYNGNFDTALWRSAANVLSLNGMLSGRTLFANDSLRSSGSIVAEGTISGANLFAGTTIRGGGLVDCDTGATSKLLWDSTTGRFSCGTDQTGGASNTAGQGLTLNGASFSVNSTLTGTLLKFSTVSGSTVYAKNTLRSSGTLIIAGNGFIRGTLSGNIINAQKSLNSSGSITAEGTISGANLFAGTTIRGGGLVDCDTAGTSKLLWDATSGRFSCGTDQTGGASNTAGQGLTLNGASFSVNSTLTGTLLKFSTVSGSTVYAKNTLRSSGTLIIAGNGFIRGTLSGNIIHAEKGITSSGSITAEGTISGANLYVGTSIRGAGLVTDCDTAATSKVLWDVTTGRFSCGTDTGGTFSTGNVLTIGGQKFVSKQGDTMTGALTVNIQGGTLQSLGLKVINTLSGAQIHAEKNLTSSGTFTTEGVARFGAGITFNSTGYILPHLSASSGSITRTTTNVDSATSYGQYTSVAIGADGLPIVSHYDTNGNLRVLKCGNMSCTAGNIATVVDSGGSSGQYTSIAIGADGLPIVSYYDGGANDNLKVTKCGNDACSAGNVTTLLDSTGDVGQYTSLAIAPDGLPVISYYDATNTSLKVIKCGNMACSSGNTTTTADNASSVGQYTSLVIGMDGFPVISYYDSGAIRLKVFKCSNAVCSSGTATTVDGGGGAAFHSVIAIGSDGYPVIARLGSSSLRFVKCGNASCSAGNIGKSVVSVTGVYPIGMAIGADGLPLLSYALDAGTLGVVKCGNASCSSDNISTTVDASSGNAGRYSSIAIGVDGLPVISYEDGVGGDLKVARCADPTCSKESGSAYSDGNRIGAPRGNGRSYAPSFEGLSVLSIGSPSSFRNLDFTTNGIVRMSITPAGRIGIGTTAPGGLVTIVTGSGTLAGSGALVLDLDGTGTGILIRSQSQKGASLAIETGTESGGLTPGIAFGFHGQFDTTITRTSSGALSFASRTGALLTLDSETSSSKVNLFQIISDSGTNENRVFRITSSGAVYADGVYNSAGADYAEWFYSGNEKLTPGEVVCIDITQNNAVKRCTGEADSNVMGIVSTNPAFVGNVITGADGIIPPGYSLIGLIGQVPAHVIVEGTGAIRPGDALTPASKPGFARKAMPGESTVGVALEGIASGEGVVNVLISRRNSSLTVDAVGQKVLDTIASMKISDEVQLMVASSLETLNVDEQIQTAVQNQVNTLQASAASILSLQEQINVLKAEMQEIGDRSPVTGTGTTTIITTTGSALPADLSASTLALEKTLNVGEDARIGGDLYLDGALMASSLFVPNGLSIDGGATVTGLFAARTITASSGATINGTLEMNGNIRMHSGSLLFDSGSALHISDLIVGKSLMILGDITIDGLARFFGDVEVRGELRVSGRQAGTLTIPAGTTGATVLFSTGFTAVPVITATPNDFVLAPWRVKPVTQTGFTIELASAQTEDVTFSWHALVGLDDGSVSTLTGTVVPNTSHIFPLGSDNIPVSSDLYWNACIRNTTIFDSDGKPHSCARYHEDYTWHHPDLNLDFLWNTAVTPPLLIIPEGYASDITEDADSIRSAFSAPNGQTSEETSSEEASSSTSSEEASSSTSSASSSSVSSVAVEGIDTSSSSSSSSDAASSVASEPASSEVSSAASEPSALSEPEEELTISPVTTDDGTASSEEPVVTEPPVPVVPEEVPAE